MINNMNNNMTIICTHPLAHNVEADQLLAVGREADRRLGDERLEVGPLQAEKVEQRTAAINQVSA